MAEVNRGSVIKKVTFTLGPDTDKIKRSLEETTSSGSSSTCERSPNKRFKKDTSSINPIPKNYVRFQLLCNAYDAGEDKLDEFISDMMNSLGARVIVKKIQSPETLIWFVIVYSRADLDLAYDLERIVGKEVVFFEVLVSSAQEALLRTFEFFLENAPKSSGVMCCLMANTAHMAIVEQWQHNIKHLSHAQIVFTPLLGEDSNDVLVEFAGDYVAVKNALYYTSIYLQRCQQQMRIPIQVQQCVLNIQTYVDILACYELPDAFEKIHKTDSHKHNNSSSDSSETGEQKIVFKSLCSIDKVADVVGKGTNVIRNIQNETGVSLKIGKIVADCNECLIAARAKERTDSGYSPAQKAIALAFSISSRDASNDPKGKGVAVIDGSSFTSRLVIPLNQIDCLLEGGQIIPEIIQATGSEIKLVDEKPECVKEKDGVVQITGGITNVEDAIYHVTGRLRDNLIFGKVDKSSTTSKKKKEVVGVVTSGGLGGPSTYVEGCSSKSSYGYANTENTTYGRIRIQDGNIELVANKKLGNLIRLKEISGARVNLLGPRLGRANQIIAIKGTPNQIQTAGGLYRAFLLNDKVVPDKVKTKITADSALKSKCQFEMSRTLRR